MDRLECCTLVHGSPRAEYRSCSEVGCGFYTTRATIVDMRFLRLTMSITDIATAKTLSKSCCRRAMSSGSPKIAGLVATKLFNFPRSSRRRDSPLPAFCSEDKCSCVLDALSSPNVPNANVVPESRWAQSLSSKKRWIAARP